MKKIILLFFVFCGTYWGLGKNIIISYDFSASMKLKGQLTNNELQAINNTLLTLLFESSNINPFSNVIDIDILKHPTFDIDFPIITKEDYITFQTVGSNINNLNLGNNVTRNIIEQYLPKNVSQLCEPNTYISKAEYEFYKKSLEDSTALWIVITDDNKNIGVQFPPDDKALQQNLLELRNDIHLTTVAGYHFLDHKNLGIWLRISKRKADYQEYLSFFDKTKSLGLQKISLNYNKDKVNIKQTAILLKGDKQNLDIVTNSTELSEKLKNIEIRLDFYNCNDLKKEIKKPIFTKILKFNEFPISIDSVEFELPKDFNIDKQPKYKLFMYARFNDGKKLHYQELIKGGIDIEILKKTTNVWQYLLIGLVLGLLGFFAWKYLFKRPKNIIVRFAIRNNRTKMEKNYEIKRGGEITFTNSSDKPTTNFHSSSNHCPDFVLVLVNAEKQLFSLEDRKSKKTTELKIGDKFNIYDIHQNEIEMQLINQSFSNKNNKFKFKN